MGEVVNFPKAKRPIPAGHEDGEQPDLRALTRAALVRLGNGDPASIIGAIADVLAGKTAGPSSPGGETP